MRSTHYVVLDTETTGLRPGKHGLTEIFAARTDGYGTITERFHSMIHPGHHIPSFISKLTGITDAMVKDAPSGEEVMKHFSHFLHKDDIVVGHNVNFDRRFIEHDLGSSLSQQSMCTMLLARRVFSPTPLPSYRLGNLAQQFALDAQGAHRAEADVRMTIGVKQALLKKLEDKQFQSVDEILRFQHLPLSSAVKLMTQSERKVTSHQEGVCPIIL